MVHVVKNERDGKIWYIPPGGGLLFGESSFEALKREMKEEFGWELLNADLIDSFESFHSINGMTEHEISYVYEVSPLNDSDLDFSIREVEEEDGKKKTFEWVEFEKIAEEQSLLYPEGLLKIIQATRQSRQRRQVAASHVDVGEKNDMLIRKAKTDDLPRLIEIDLIAKANQEGRRDLISSAIDKDECHVVALNHEIVGYIVLNYTFYSQGWIDLLYIKEDFRGKGIGGKLIDHVEPLCAKDKLFTSTNLSNLRMQRLLEKKKFSISGVIHNLDEGDPEIIYFKSLDKTSSKTIKTKIPIKPA